MDEVYSFQESILSEKIDIASSEGDEHYADGLTRQLRNLQNANENTKIARSIDFLKHAGGLLIEHFLEQEVPKSRLLTRTVNYMKPDSTHTVATGWILSLSDLDVEESNPNPIYNGYLINKSKNIFGFKESELMIEKNETKYRVSRYSSDYRLGIIDLAIPYPDLSGVVVGAINTLEYADRNQRNLIESILAHAAIKEDMEKKIVSTWQPMIYNQS